MRMYPLAEVSKAIAMSQIKIDPEPGSGGWRGVDGTETEQLFD